MWAIWILGGLGVLFIGAQLLFALLVPASAFDWDGEADKYL